MRKWCGGAGDCLWYCDSFATVDKFGLLNTQLVLTNGNRVWVRACMLFLAPSLAPSIVYFFRFAIWLLAS